MYFSSLDTNMESTVNRNPLVYELKTSELDAFKSKADELTVLAGHIPEIFYSDAKIYFYQHCDALIQLLGIERKYTEENKRIAQTDLGQAIFEVEDGIISDVCTTSSVKSDVQTMRKEVNLHVNEVNNKICSDEFKKSSSDLASVQKMTDSKKICRDFLEGDYIAVQPLSTKSACKKKRTLYHDENLEIFCESVHKEEKDLKTNDENRLEIFDEATDEREASRNTNDLSEKENNATKSEPDMKCDITELIRCIPKLSQYLDVDQKNVTVLKDNEEDDNCIHLSVELSDGTVQKFKIAGNVPSINALKGIGSLENGETEIDNTELEQKDNQQNTDIRADTSLTVYDRRLRTRQHKAPVIHRGPGRPKNENIPAPEINEKGETFYRCEECKATVKSYNALIVHMRTHTGSRPFHCSFCNKSFTTKGNKKAHETTTHSDVKPWKCEYCDKSFKEKKVLKIHERIHTGEKPYSCSICNKAFSQRSVMLEHILTHSNSRPHLCDFCGQGFRGLSSLKAHKKRHVGLREFQCNSCEKAFVCKNELKRHMLTHTGEKPYSCHICSKAFTRHSYLKEHINLHTGARPYTCTECNLTFSDSMSLHRHKKKHEADEANLIQRDESEANIVTNSTASQVTNTDMEQSLMLEIPEHVTLSGEQTSIQVVVDENTSVEDFQKLHSLLLSATGNGDMMINSQDAAKHLYQVLCVNPDTQEVLGQVQGQEVIVEGQNGDITEINLQYSG